jgi:hypothetical protein
VLRSSSSLVNVVYLLTVNTRRYVQLVQNTQQSSSLIIQAGAKIGPSLDHAHLIIGIKETPMDALARQRSPVRLSTATNGVIPRTHVMFSHTAKGQPYNTGLLSQFVAPTDRVLGESALQFEKTMELWPRLIDYELLTNEEGKRTVGFGWFAGGVPPFLSPFRGFNDVCSLGSGWRS